MTTKQRKERAAALRKQRAKFAEIRQQIKNAFKAFEEQSPLVSDYHRLIEGARLKRIANAKAKKIKSA